MSDKPIPGDLRWLDGLAPDLIDEVVRLRAAEAALAEATRKLEILPADWQTDSSLETWFPFTAEELERTKQQLSEAQQEIARLADKYLASQSLLRESQQQVTQQAATNRTLRNALKCISEQFDCYWPTDYKKMAKEALASIPKEPQEN